MKQYNWKKRKELRIIEDNREKERKWKESMHTYLRWMDKQLLEHIFVCTSARTHTNVHTYVPQV